MLFRQAAWLLPALGLLGACSVYVPMQGAVPAIRQRGELEVGAGWSLTNRLDAAATYSPLPHLLVRAAASAKGSRQNPADSSAYAHVSQYEVALGTYWPLGQRVLVGGLLGVGRTHVDALFRGDGGSLHGFILANRNPLHRYEGSYRKHTAEVYASWQLSPYLAVGATGRLTQVQLNGVTDLGAAVPEASLLRAEPMVFVRFWPRTAQPGLLQVQVALGTSRTLGYDPLTAGDASDPARQFKLPEAYIAAGLVLYPHLWWQRRKQE